MSLSNFDDINRICIEMGEEKEAIGLLEPTVVKFKFTQEDQTLSKHSSFFEDDEMFP